MLFVVCEIVGWLVPLVVKAVVAGEGARCPPE
jgi:hypothetical protein